MENKLSIKVNKFDFNKVLDNYLDEKLWKKTWTIFEYMNIVVTMNLYSINIRNNKIGLLAKVQFPNSIHSRESIMELPLDKEHRNLKVFNNTLVGTIGKLIEEKERQESQNSVDYRVAKRHDNEYESILEQRAEELLDQEGVTHEDIRDAYIDTYKYDHSIDTAFAVQWKAVYTIYPQFYLSLALFMENKDKYDSFSHSIKQANNEVVLVEVYKKMLSELETALRDEVITQELFDEYVEYIQEDIEWFNKDDYEEEDDEE